ncbi:MAPEG family protein [Porticoccaceae bacterium]|jgi:hypothetical protein|nr:MAPEG family protein [Porticoccaceae bacterium]MDA9346281.1 MAPEG family protein [Porticoccaceae bacterium]MDB4109357.1 MAPEG family protein [Porticoccaceae bacterium]MDC1477552.1 MAPEG family protein [Porticoccaceae bacterium]CAI8254120.1 MAG: Uncharacterised protein [SAR92 bacterium MED-G29]|tara:strand:+ start:1457 stop:1864 length:408 start_codon:yes stop_codon:yes gene_type:complete
MDIMYPIFTLVMFTFVMAFAVGSSRFISVRRRQVNPKYFVLMTGDAPPEYVQKLSRNFANLLEVPMLFYVLGAFVMALDINNSALVQHAWLFVGLRVVHSIIHVTYNHVIHRFTVFVLSTLALLAMWIQLISLVG